MIIISDGFGSSKREISKTGAVSTASRRGNNIKADVPAAFRETLLHETSIEALGGLRMEEKISDSALASFVTAELTPKNLLDGAASKMDSDWEELGDNIAAIKTQVLQLVISSQILTGSAGPEVLEDLRKILPEVSVAELEAMRDNDALPQISNSNKNGGGDSGNLVRQITANPATPFVRFVAKWGLTSVAGEASSVAGKIIARNTTASEYDSAYAAYRNLVAANNALLLRGVVSILAKSGEQYIKGENAIRYYSLPLQTVTAALAYYDSTQTPT